MSYIITILFKPINFPTTIPKDLISIFIDLFRMSLHVLKLIGLGVDANCILFLGSRKELNLKYPSMVSTAPVGHVNR